jgi:hypothetical protein
MAGINDMVSGTMNGMGMTQGSQIPGAVQGIGQQQPQAQQGKNITPEMEAKYQQALQGDAGAMANFIVMVLQSMGG